MALCKVWFVFPGQGYRLHVLAGRYTKVPALAPSKLTVQAARKRGGGCHVTQRCHIIVQDPFFR